MCLLLYIRDAFILSRCFGYCDVFGVFVVLCAGVWNHTCKFKCIQICTVCYGRITNLVICVRVASVDIMCANENVCFRLSQQVDEVIEPFYPIFGLSVGRDFLGVTCFPAVK